jgi:hypothetical protein
VAEDICGDSESPLLTVVYFATVNLVRLFQQLSVSHHRHFEIIHYTEASDKVAQLMVTSKIRVSCL